MLFKDTTKLKEYAEFGEVNFASIKATLRNVEQTYLVPVISPELYAQLNTAYNDAEDEGTLTDGQKSLLDACRRVIAPYLTYSYIPKTEVMVSDAGVRRAETGTMKTAYGNQVVNAREQYLTEAETAVEQLLQFMEANKADYGAWTGSTTFTAYRGLFVKSGAEFAACFTAQGPYRVYQAIKSKMVEVEESGIYDALGAALYNMLKTKGKLATPTYSEKEKRLLFYLQRAVSNLAFSFALPYLAIRMDANGVTVLSNNSAGRTKDYEIRQAASAEEKRTVMLETASVGRTWLDKAIAYLNTNYADFPDWPAPATAKPVEQCSGNADLKGTFGFL